MNLQIGSPVRWQSLITSASVLKKEKSQMYEIGAKDIIEKILPIVDNFERGLASMPEDEKATPFAEGMEKIYKQLMTTLEGIGVKPIEAVGQNSIRIFTMQ